MIDQNLLAMADEAANKYGIPTDLFRKVIQQESGWNPGAVSSKGAIGLGQIMPGTASDLKIDPRDPAQNLDGAARYLSQQYQQFGTWPLALAGYNAGPGNVQKYGNKIPPFPETEGYVNSITGLSPDHQIATGHAVPQFLPGSGGQTKKPFSNASALRPAQSLMDRLGATPAATPQMSLFTFLSDPESRSVQQQHEDAPEALQDQKSVPEQDGQTGMNSIPPPKKVMGGDMGQSAMSGFLRGGLSALGNEQPYQPVPDAETTMSRLIAMMSALGGGVMNNRRQQ